MVHRHVISRGFKIYYVDEGSGTGLVLIPGILMSAARWVETGYVREFSPDFRVLAMDPLGHGLSDKPSDPAAYGMEEIVRDVLAVMDDAGLEQAHVWGYSRGGRIAAAVATIAPERVLSLVCGGTPLALDPGAREQASGLVQRLGAAASEASPDGFWSLWWSFMDMNHATREILQQDQEPAAIVAALSAMLEPYASDLSGLASTPLAYVGATDVAVSPDLLRAQWKAQGVDIVEVPGRDHGGTFQDLATVAPLVRRHLAENSGARV